MIGDNSLFSFSSANTFPMKIILNADIINSALENKVIPSVHYQINPTNRCNFNCPICSCSEREKDKELSRKEVISIINVGLMHGIKAVTITGGGEPLMHPYINQIIEDCNKMNIRVGIVTNGTLLDRLDSLDSVTWVRISSTDYLKSQLIAVNMCIGEWLNNISESVNEYKNVDWSFSHVLTNRPNYHLVKELIEFGNGYEFTHIRIVNDIFNADSLGVEMEYIKGRMKEDVNDEIVNYQDRSMWTKGSNPCYLSILKPVIGADGYIYPCCGTQYALENPSRDYEKLMRMGDISSLNELMLKQSYFDGSKCVKCYYSEYNRVLGILLNGLKHEEFV